MYLMKQGTQEPTRLTLCVILLEMPLDNYRIARAYRSFFVQMLSNYQRFLRIAPDRKVNFDRVSFIHSHEAPHRPVNMYCVTR